MPRIRPTTVIQLPSIAGLVVELHYKRVRNLNLRIHPSKGRIQVSAPHSCSRQFVEQWVRSKQPWIERQQQRLATRQTAVEHYPYEHGLVSGVALDWFGERRTVTALEAGPPEDSQTFCHRGASVHLTPSVLMFEPDQIRDGVHGREVLRAFYKHRLQSVIADRLPHWSAIAGVKPDFIGIRRMRSRWGSCHIGKRRIWLNLELARMPIGCIDHVLVHELAHLHERGHNARFYGFMDRFMPDWRTWSDELERRGIAGI